MNTTACSSFQPLSWDPGTCSSCGAMAEMHEPVIPASVDAETAAKEDLVADRREELPAGVQMINAMNRALFPSLFPGVEAPKR